MKQLLRICSVICMANDFDDPDAFLEDIGDDCLRDGAQTGFKAIFSVDDSVIDLPDGSAVAAGPQIMLRTQTVSDQGLAKGVPVIVSGKRWVCKVPQRIDDGVFCIIPLAKG